MIVYKPLSHIRAISFDLDDTLYDNMPYIHKAEKLLAEYIAKHYPIASCLTQTQWLNFKRQILKAQPDLVNDIGALRITAMTNAFVSVGMDSDLIPSAVSDCFDYFYYQRSNFKVAKPVRNILKELSTMIPIAAITNGNADLNAIGIAKYFSCIVHASPKHPMKPNSAMFDHVAESLDIPANNILHVGDCLDKDIKGAINSGYQSAWLAVNRPMNLVNEDVSLLPHIQLDELKELTEFIAEC